MLSFLSAVIMLSLYGVVVSSCLRSTSLPIPTATTSIPSSSSCLAPAVITHGLLSDLSSVIITSTFLAFGRDPANTTCAIFNAAFKSGVPVFRGKLSMRRFNSSMSVISSSKRSRTDALSPYTIIAGRMLSTPS